MSSQPHPQHRHNVHHSHSRLPKYDHLTLAAFRVPDHVDRLPAIYQALRFPERWIGLLSELAQANRRAEDRAHPIRLKIDGLNRAVQALVGGMLSVEPRAGTIQQRQWLYSPTPLDPAVLYRIVRAWARSAYKNAPLDLRERVLESLDAQDLAWQPIALDLAAWYGGPYNTATPDAEQSPVFTILPDVVAGLLTRTGRPWDVNGYVFNEFRRAPCPPGSSGVEIVSWPPYAPNQPTRRGPPSRTYPVRVSLVLTITLQTVAFQPWPELYIDVSLRRWMGSPVRYVPDGRSSAFITGPAAWNSSRNDTQHEAQYPQYSAQSSSPLSFLRTSVVWQHASSFARLNYAQDPIPEAASSQEAGKRGVWGDYVPTILEAVKPLTPYPEAMDVLRDPIAWLDTGRDGVFAGIAFDEGMRPDHPAEKGMMPGDRHPLLVQITDRLAPAFEWVSPIPVFFYDGMRPFVLDTAAVPPDGGLTTSHPADELVITGIGEDPLEDDTTDTDVFASETSDGSEEIQADGDDDDDMRMADPADTPADTDSDISMDTDTDTGTILAASTTTDTISHAISQAAGAQERLTYSIDASDLEIVAALEAQQMPASALERWQQAVSASIRTSFTFELLYQSKAVLRAVVGAFTYYLGLPHIAPSLDANLDEGKATWQWEIAGRPIQLRAEPLGPLGGALRLEPSSRPKREQVLAAVHARHAEIVARFGDSRDPVAGVIIELDGDDKFARGTDPKQALRRAFAHAGRCTQFLTPLRLSVVGTTSTQELERAHRDLWYRARQSVRDLFRQLGVQIMLPTVRLPAAPLPDPLNLLGIWVIRRHRSAANAAYELPVVVWMRSDRPVIYATAYGFFSPPERDENGAWLPYTEALLALGQQRYAEPRRNIPVATYLQQLLTDQVTGDTVVFAEASNLRRAWPWLANKHIAPDAVSFTGNDLLPIDRLPGLRIVRIRTPEGHETPECYGYRADLGHLGLPEGLYQMGDRVFGSTTAKPVAFKSTSASLSRFGTWHTTKGQHRPPSLITSAWNPGLMEITVAGIQGKEPVWPWAALAHELRKGSLAYDDALARPLPLHLAKRLAEYVAPLDHLWDALDDADD